MLCLDVSDDFSGMPEDSLAAEDLGEFLKSHLKRDLVLCKRGLVQDKRDDSLAAEDLAEIFKSQRHSILVVMIRAFFFFFPM